MPNTFRTAHYDTLTINGSQIDDALDELTGGESVESEVRRTRDRWLMEATSNACKNRQGGAPTRLGH